MAPPAASSSRAAQSTTEEEDRRRRLAHSKAKKQARREGEATATSSMKRNKLHRKRIIHDSEEDEDEDEVASNVAMAKQVKAGTEAAARNHEEGTKRRPPITAARSEGKSKQRQQEKEKEKGDKRSRPAMTQDDSSDEEPLSAVAKRHRSLSRERSRPNPFAQSQDSTTSRPPIASSSKPTSSSSKSGGKSSSFLVPGAKPSSKSSSQDTPNTTRPSLHVDTYEAHSPADVADRHVNSAPTQVPQGETNEPSSHEPAPAVSSQEVEAISKRASQDEPTVDPRPQKRQALEGVTSAQAQAAPNPSPAPQPVPKPAPTAVAPDLFPLPRLTRSPPPMSSSPTGSPPPAAVEVALSPAAPLQAARVKTEPISSYSRVAPARVSSFASAQTSGLATRAAGPTRASSLASRASPSITRASPSATRASLAVHRASSAMARASPSSSTRPATARYSPVLAPRPSTTRPIQPGTPSTGDHNKGGQGPTPEPTPEAESRAIVKGAVSLQLDSIPLEQQAIPDGKSLVQFQCELDDQRTLTRLRDVDREDDTLPLQQLPLRARAVITRTVDDGKVWPKVSFSLNGDLISRNVTRLDPGSLIAARRSFSIALRQGVNTLTLARWKTDALPADLRVSIELYRSISTAWLRAHLRDDEKTYELYSDRASVGEPVGVSIFDPTSNVRIVTPVRGTDCAHLEAFDLDTHLATNQQRDLGDWLCPHASCRAYAPPTSLAVCRWQADALGSIDDGISILDVVKIAEDKPSIKDEVGEQ